MDTLTLHASQFSLWNENVPYVPHSTAIVGSTLFIVTLHLSPATCFLFLPHMLSRRDYLPLCTDVFLCMKSDKLFATSRTSHSELNGNFFFSEPFLCMNSDKLFAIFRTSHSELHGNFFFLPHILLPSLQIKRQSILFHAVRRPTVCCPSALNNCYSRSQRVISCFELAHIFI